MTRHECPACHSAHWATLTECLVCEQRVCDQCPGSESIGPYDLVCRSCMASALEVVERIRPDLYEVVCDEIEARGQNLDAEPLTYEEWREVVECKSVEEVRQVFKKHCVPCVPIRKETGRARNWREDKAA